MIIYLKTFSRHNRSYIISIFICILVELLSSFTTQTSVNTWYKTIIKPDFTPPNWLFAPVWTILYLLMGFSWGRINKIAKNQELITVNVAFIIQLLLNFSWSFIYFGANKIGIAFVDIILLWIFIIINIYFFYKIDRIASLLLLPYLFWTSYAVILNGAIWHLNK